MRFEIPQPPRSQTRSRYAGRPGTEEAVLPSHRGLEKFLASHGLDKDTKADVYEPFLLEEILKARIQEDKGETHETPLSKARKLLYAGIPNEEHLSDAEILTRLKQFLFRKRHEWEDELAREHHDPESYHERKEAVDERIQATHAAIEAYRAGTTGTEIEPSVRMIEDLCIDAWHSERVLAALRSPHDRALSAIKQEIAMLQPLRNAFYRRRLAAELYPQAQPQRTGT